MEMAREVKAPVGAKTAVEAVVEAAKAVAAVVVGTSAGMQVRAAEVGAH